MNEVQEAILLGAKEIHNLREQNKELQKRLDFMIEQNDKKQQVLDKIKEYIEHENFRRNILLGLSEKKYTRDILNHILEMIEETK